MTVGVSIHSQGVFTLRSKFSLILNTPPQAQVGSVSDNIRSRLRLAFRSSRRLATELRNPCFILRCEELRSPCFILHCEELRSPCFILRCEELRSPCFYLRLSSRLCAIDRLFATLLHVRGFTRFGLPFRGLRGSAYSPPQACGEGLVSRTLVWPPVLPFDGRFERFWQI